MARNRGLVIAGGIGILALTGFAVAAEMRGDRNEVSEREIAVNQVPHGALAGATEQLASVSRAELITFRDGSTVYDLTGRTHSGAALEVRVTASGQVIRTGLDDDDDDDGD